MNLMPRLIEFIILTSCGGIHPARIRDRRWVLRSRQPMSPSARRFKSCRDQSVRACRAAVPGRPHIPPATHGRQVQSAPYLSTQGRSCPGVGGDGRTRKPIRQRRRFTRPHVHAAPTIRRPGISGSSGPGMGPGPATLTVPIPARLYRPGTRPRALVPPTARATARAAPACIQPGFERGLPCHAHAPNRISRRRRGTTWLRPCPWQGSRPGQASGI